MNDFRRAVLYANVHYWGSLSSKTDVDNRVGISWLVLRRFRELITNRIFRLGVKYQMNSYWNHELERQMRESTILRKSL